ncbi:MAG: carbon storage regulator [Acidimicrobiales bacterium]
MLVLNRRPGESIVIEPDLRVTVLSVTDRRVWIGMCASGSLRDLRVSATVVSPSEARLEIVPMSSVQFHGDRVRITAPAGEDPASAARAGLAIDRHPGERVEIGDDLWVAITSISKGNPTLTFGGSAIGDELSVTLIRPAGSYVRIGVDAPNRRVYREELWDAVQASGDTRGAPPARAGFLPPDTPLEPPELEPPAAELPRSEPPVRSPVPADSLSG